MMKSTQELEHQIRNSTTAQALTGADYTMPSLPIYLSSLLHRHRLTVQDVVVRCNLDRSYAYQLFNGTRRPSRGFLLRLALLLKLGEDETQRLLRQAALAEIYPKNKRDAIIGFGITHQMELSEINDKLFVENEKSLF